MRRDIADALVSLEAGAEPGSVAAVFRFDPARPVFQGHFPGRPLLPGVFEIEMVRYAVERRTGKRYDVSRVDKAKFTGEIKPGDVVAVAAAVEETGEGICVKARLRVGETPKATLSIVLDPAEAEGQGGR